MLKFLHIGDVHLDTSFYSKKDNLRRILREGIRKSFSKAIDACIIEKVDALLIAGDLFDNDKLSFKTEQLLINEFSRLKENNINVFYTTGNHDPGHISYRVNSIRWPENVYIFKNDEVEAIEMKSSNTGMPYRIISCGHKTNNEGRNLVKKFPHKAGNKAHIGLLHTMVANTKDGDNHGRYLPCTREDLESKGYDYWALGHIHKRQSVSDKSAIYYPGNIQGRHPKEIGKKGGLLVTIDENSNVNIEFRPFSSIEWHTLNIRDLEDIKEYAKLKVHVRNIIENYIEKNGLNSGTLILRIELEGRAYLRDELILEENVEEIEEELILDLELMDLEIKTDSLLRVINTEEYKKGNHVLSEVLKLLNNPIENQELLNRLLELPLLKKGIRKREERIAYIKELLEGTQEEAVSYMVGDDDAGN